MTALETTHLILRDERPADVDAFYAYRCKESYWRHIPMEPPTRDEVAARIERFLPQQNAQDRHLYFWAVEEKPSNNLIGEASMMLMYDKSARCGFSLCDLRWGLGYGTEVACCILEFGFRHLGLHRIDAQVAPSNAASIRVLEKIGMAREGVLREIRRARGDWWALVQFSVLEDEFYEALKTRGTGRPAGMGADQV